MALEEPERGGDDFVERGPVDAPRDCQLRLGIVGIETVRELLLELRNVGPAVGCDFTIGADRWTARIEAVGPA